MCFTRQKATDSCGNGHDVWWVANRAEATGERQLTSGASSTRTVTGRCSDSARPTEPGQVLSSAQARTNEWDE